MSKPREKLYKVMTFCNFGDTGRRSVLSKHKSIATAMRQYPRLWDTYGKLHQWKVWQEMVCEANLHELEEAP